MLKSSCHALRFRLGHTLRRRLAGLNVISECPVQHAHRTEFHCSGKLITATRADASVLHWQTMVAFHEELTVACKSMFSNKIPETVELGRHCETRHSERISRVGV